ncbi:hypothetical protein VP01_1628g1 [Puccinia sorghi]|uniref:Uncharacterized protein n=1 Tax=Puccinia sorghi TaxID=27349 RepID=A0A0L6VGZ6_9BASI|nr:hypothetical protein VP01_1628g1 [Puccinia sorghi]
MISCKRGLITKNRREELSYWSKPDFNWLSSVHQDRCLVGKFTNKRKSKKEFPQLLIPSTSTTARTQRKIQYGRKLNHREKVQRICPNELRMWTKYRKVDQYRYHYLKFHLAAAAAEPFAYRFNQKLKTVYYQIALKLRTPEIEDLTVEVPIVSNQLCYTSTTPTPPLLYPGVSQDLLIYESKWDSVSKERESNQEEEIGTKDEIEREEEGGRRKLRGWREAGKGKEEKRLINNIGEGEEESKHRLPGGIQPPSNNSSSIHANDIGIDCGGRQGSVCGIGNGSEGKMGRSGGKNETRRFRVVIELFLYYFLLFYIIDYYNFISNMF